MVRAVRTVGRIPSALGTTFNDIAYDSQTGNYWLLDDIRQSNGTQAVYVLSPSLALLRTVYIRVAMTHGGMTIENGTVYTTDNVRSIYSFATSSTGTITPATFISNAQFDINSISSLAGYIYYNGGTNSWRRILISTSRESRFLTFGSFARVFTVTHRLLVSIGTDPNFISVYDYLLNHARPEIPITSGTTLEYLTSSPDAVIFVTSTNQVYIMEDPVVRSVPTAWLRFGPPSTASRPAAPRRLFSTTANARGIAYLASSLYVLYSDRSIRQYSIHTGALLRTTPNVVPAGHTPGGLAARGSHLYVVSHYNAGGRNPWLVRISRLSIGANDAITADGFRILDRHVNETYAVGIAFSPDGNSLYVMRGTELLMYPVPSAWNGTYLQLHGLAGIVDIKGIAIDGTRLYAADDADNSALAYRIPAVPAAINQIVTLVREPSDDFDIPADADGITSNGSGSFYVVTGDGAVYSEPRAIPAFVPHRAGWLRYGVLDKAAGAGWHRFKSIGVSIGGGWRRYGIVEKAVRAVWTRFGLTAVISFPAAWLRHAPLAISYSSGWHRFKPLVGISSIARWYRWADAVTASFSAGWRRYGMPAIAYPAGWCRYAPLVKSVPAAWYRFRLVDPGWPAGWRRWVIRVRDWRAAWTRYGLVSVTAYSAAWLRFAPITTSSMAAGWTRFRPVAYALRTAAWRRYGMFDTGMLGAAQGLPAAAWRRYAPLVSHTGAGWLRYGIKTIATKAGWRRFAPLAAGTSTAGWLRYGVKVRGVRAGWTRYGLVTMVEWAAGWRRFKPVDGAIATGGWRRFKPLAAAFRAAWSRHAPSRAPRLTAYKEPQARRLRV